MNNQIKAMQLISQKKKTSHVLSSSIENARIDNKLSKLQ